MPKLIVSDLDGTLLPQGATSLSPATKRCIEQAVGQGATFCVCSGRSYVHLKKIFSGITASVYYICCDGALCIYNDEILFDYPISSNTWCTRLQTANALAVSDYTVYASIASQPFYRQAMQLYNGHVLPFCDLGNSKIYKLILQNAPLNLFPELQEVYRKDGWQEYVQAGVSKGVAVKRLMERLAFDSDSTILFGDGKNDISMASLGKSYLIGSGFFGAEKYFTAKASGFTQAMQMEMNNK